MVEVPLALGPQGVLFCNWLCLVSGMTQLVKNSRANVRSLGGEDLLEGGMAAHSSIPAWRIPWTEELGGLQSMGSEESDTTEAT